LARQQAGPGAAVDANARAAAARLLRFFDTTVARHHAHEERLLFPALLEAMAGSDAVCLRELTRGLADEHRELDAAWRRLRGALVRIAAGEPASLAPDAVDALAMLYRRHIECEDKELLPMVARLVADDELLRIGRAMREGRDTG
ncbi:MAG: hypothetical protein JWR68_1597, partial [Polaromonas sp.]|nr:hypothetical protein [Polaromonas sp.]